MSQTDQIENIMSKLQNYATIPNGIITAEEIEKAFRNYGLNPIEINKPISEHTRTEIFDMLLQKMNDGKCTSSLGFIDDGWNFFETNYPRDGRIPNFYWKVYIPIKAEHYGFAAKNVISVLCNNGSVSSCKLSGTMRSDSMIVNLENADDVTKLNEYLDTIPSLKSCLGNHQPFIPDWNGIGVIRGNDVKTSYTERLSGYLAHYINVCKQQNRLDLINAESFLESMKNALANGMVQRPDEIQQIVEHIDIILNDKDYVQYDDPESQHKL